VYPYLARHIFGPALDFSRGTRTMHYLKELEASQWWSRSKILELQNECLGKLMEQTYRDVPYYRRIFDERALKPCSIHSAKDLEKLPVLTKQIIRDHSAELLSAGFTARQRVRFSTGGSTGEPLQFYRTRPDELSRDLAAAQRALGWAGYELGDKLARIAVVRPYPSIIHRISESGKHLFERYLMIDAKQVSAQTLPFYVKQLEKFQPRFICGYPNAIELAARFILKAGRPHLKPAAIITDSEQLYDYQRELFSSVFGCPTFSNYDSWEAHAIATECAEHSGLHIAAENLIVEIVDDAGNQLSAGREGRIAITSLHNHAMPFIRYIIGDLGVAKDELCHCGRGLPLLAGLSGRTTDVIYTKSGKAISGTALLHVFLPPMGVSQFQFVQESYEKVVIKVIMDRNYPKAYLDDLTSRLTQRYKKLLEENLDIRIEFVDAIPLTKDGKRKVIISKLNSAR
jgi:phenylacetate-CoA ligase